MWVRYSNFYRRISDASQSSQHADFKFVELSTMNLLLLRKRGTVSMHNVKWLQLMDQPSAFFLDSSMCLFSLHKYRTVNSPQPLCLSEPFIFLLDLCCKFVLYVFPRLLMRDSRRQNLFSVFFPLWFTPVTGFCVLFFIFRGQFSREQFKLIFLIVKKSVIALWVQ